MADFTDVVFVDWDVLPTGPLNASAPVVPSTPPTVTFLDPLPGAEIAANGAVTVTVTDPEANISLVCVSAAFAGLMLDEVIMRGLTPTARYANSTATEITGGYQLAIRRNGGWPSAPTIYVDASDGGVG